MLETKQKGILTELQCLTVFNQYGFNVSIPYGENSRYDFIVDENNHLLRIQVKSCHGFTNSEGQLAGIQFTSKSTRVNSRGAISKTYTLDEIDYFATFWNGVCYLIPVEECSSEKKLWFITSKHNTNSCLAKNYTLEKQLADYTDEFEYLLRDEKNEQNFNYQKIKVAFNANCKKCNKPIVTNITGLCQKCYNEQKAEHIPSREELKEKIYNNSFVEVGKQYNVSDNAIRKWCKKYNLPFQKTVIKNISKEDWLAI